MRVRTVLFIAAGMVGAAVGGATISSAISDTDVDVGTAAVTGIRTDPDGAEQLGSTSGPAGAGAGADGAVTVQSVEGLEQLAGRLSAGEEPDDWYVSGVEVDFGPDVWLSGAPSFEDYDGDGDNEPLLTELAGLEGRDVTLGVRYEIEDDWDDARDDADAFTIDGLAFRDPAGGPAPWQTELDGAEATLDEVAASAVAAVDEGAVAISVERESDDGWSGWNVEVRAGDGGEFQVYLNRAGDVVDVRPDDD